MHVQFQQYRLALPLKVPFCTLLAFLLPFLFKDVALGDVCNFQHVEAKFEGLSTALILLNLIWHHCLQLCHLIEACKRCVGEFGLLKRANHLLTILPLFPHLPIFTGNILLAPQHLGLLKAF